MRFPIRYIDRSSLGPRRRLSDPPSFEYTNLSRAVQESLLDLGIIDPETRRPRQDYFDLNIQEGNLLELLLRFFDFTGSFHAGCVADRRPPSFSFSASVGDSKSRQGAFSLICSRSIKLEAFFREGGFRKPSRFGRGDSGHVRDLEALARAYNDLGNYTETIGIYWGGWIGEESEIGKWGFAGAHTAADFDNEKLQSLNGYQDLLEGGRVIGGPRYANTNPLYEVGKGKILAEMARRHRESDYRSFTQTELTQLGLSVADVLIGLIEFSEAAGIRIKLPVADNEGLVRMAFSP